MKNFDHMDNNDAADRYEIDMRDPITWQDASWCAFFVLIFLAIIALTC